MKTEQNLISATWSTRRVLQLVFLLTAGILLSACKQESKVVDVADPTGVFTLVSVNGNKVPASVSHDGTPLQVRSGSFTIKADGTCGTTTVFVPPSGKEATREVSATYTKEGSKVTMQWQGAG